MRKYIFLLILFLGVVYRCANFLMQPNYDKSIKGFENQKLTAVTTKITTVVQDSLPKIHADLLLGMTIGVDTIKQDKNFYQNLITTGLVHVVVVSGYNVALVIGFVSSIFYQKLRASNKLYILLFLVVYVVLCGLQPPVIRAALMGYIAYIASTEGRGIEGLQLLIFVCLCMLIVYPAYIISLSFWLSTLATLGLMFYQKYIQDALTKVFKSLGIPLEDLSSSLACQITVWPIISYFFGRLSLYSPMYNMVVLWLIPICTVLGFIYLLLAFVLPPLASLFSLLLVPFYDTFVRAIDFFAYIDRGNVSLSISLPFFVFYYATLVVLTFWFKSRLLTKSAHPI